MVDNHKHLYSTHLPIKVYTIKFYLQGVESGYFALRVLLARWKFSPSASVYDSLPEGLTLGAIPLFVVTPRTHLPKIF